MAVAAAPAAAGMEVGVKAEDLQGVAVTEAVEKGVECLVEAEKAVEA